MPSPWVWDDAAQRYRDTETGRWMGAKQMVEARDEFVEYLKAESDSYVQRLAEGQNIGRWQLDMEERIRQAYIDEYTMAVGGRNNMTQADWGRVGEMIKEQDRYLNKFAIEVRAGNLSDAQIKARSRMYMDSATQAYERGRAAAMGLPPLPAYPGDGQTVCKANCKCHWEIEPIEGDGWDCTWSLGDAEHCPDCVENAQKWNPLHVERPNA